MDWLFSSPPSLLQWIGIFAGLTALGVAIRTTVFPMIWGKPRIAVGVDIVEFNSSRVLECAIYNNPVKNRLLRWLGVKTTVAEDIVVDFSIEELGSRRRVIRPQDMPSIKSYTGVGPAQRISLPASPIPVRFGIVEVLANTGVVTLFEENVPLANGSYCAHIEVVVEGKVNRARSNFKVTDKHPFAYWVGRIEKDVLKHKRIA